MWLKIVAGVVFGGLLVWELLTPEPIRFHKPTLKAAPDVPLEGNRLFEWTYQPPRWHTWLVSAVTLAVFSTLILLAVRYFYKPDVFYTAAGALVALLVGSTRHADITPRSYTVTTTGLWAQTLYRWRSGETEPNQAPQRLLTWEQVDKVTRTGSVLRLDLKADTPASGSTWAQLKRALHRRTLVELAVDDAPPEVEDTIRERVDAAT